MAGDRFAIHIEGLTKYYGKKRGILDVDLDVAEGEVFGYLGPNGAGKTTTIRLLLNLLFPTRGKATVLGRSITRGSVEIRRNIGYLPGELNLYGNLTGEEFLRYAASLRGGVDWRHVTDIMTRLACKSSAPIRSLSHGNKQKIGLVMALMHRPSLMILDEPTNGLDPLVQQEFHVMVNEVKKEGRTIFLSSHILPEVERVCDRVGIIRDGRLAAVEDVVTLKGRAVRRLEIHFGEPVPQERFASIPGVSDVTFGNNTLRCAVTGELDALVKAASAHRVIDIISHEPSLEEAFLSYYGKGEPNA